jgi:hypothetical protein
MNESIYNLIPPEYKAPVKEPIHRSKHDPQAPLTGSTFGEVTVLEHHTALDFHIF